MNKKKAQHGFSLIELLVVMAMFTVFTGALFLQINDAQQRASAEQTKTDLMQESREFMDQMTRDLRDSGYPNRRNFAPGQLTDGSIPDQKAQAAAVGVVKVDAGEIVFEGAVNNKVEEDTNSAEVSSIRYFLSNDCPTPPCLKRSETPKKQGDPVTEQGSNPQVEVQNVVNDLTTEPIFSAFKVDGTPVTLPVDISNGDATASIGTIKIYLRVQSKYPDPKTREKPILTFVSTVKLPNCSMAYSSQGQSCN